MVNRFQRSTSMQLQRFILHSVVTREKSYAHGAMAIHWTERESETFYLLNTITHIRRATKMFNLELYQKTMKRARRDEDFLREIIGEYIELLNDKEQNNLNESVTDWEQEKINSIKSLNFRSVK